MVIREKVRNSNSQKVDKKYVKSAKQRKDASPAVKTSFEKEKDESPIINEILK